MTATPSTPSPRYEVGVRALVAGLAPVVLPLVIRHIEQSSMALTFEDNAQAVDDRWATADAGVMIIFKVDVGGSERRRVTVHGQLQARDAQGIVVRMIALDEATVAALRSLVQEAQARRAKAPDAAARKAAAAKAQQEARAKARGALEVVVHQQAAVPLNAYLDALAGTLSKQLAQARSPAEQKKYDAWVSAFAKARGALANALQGVVTAGFASYLHAKADRPRGADGGLLEGGLSLMESTDLRASLAIAEAIGKLATDVQGSWQALASQLAQVADNKPEECILAPALLCHQMREVISEDGHLGALRQFDFAAGFSDGFITRLDQFYGTLGRTLGQFGFHAQTGGARGA